MKRSIPEFSTAIDRRFDASHSVVLRYRHALRLEETEQEDSRLKDLLTTTSVREGLRVLPLLRYNGVEVDILDETSLMYTNTVKSIDGCVTAAKCLLNGHRRLVFESGGNTGLALTQYCGRAGLETFFFVPSENLALLDGRAFDRNSAHLIAVDAVGMVKQVGAAFTVRNDLTHVPQAAWRYQATAFLGCFLLEHLLEHAGYDYLVQSISAAFGPIGIYRILEPHQGTLGALPTFLGIQQEANCPMVRAWRNGSRKIQTQPIRSTAGLLTQVMYDSEPSTYGTTDDLWRILDATRGDLTTVNHDDFGWFLGLRIDAEGVLDHLKSKGVDIALRDGEVIDKTGLLGLVGALKAIASQRITEGSRVLVCLTGGTARPDGRARPDCRLAADDDTIPAAAVFEGKARG